MGEVSWKDVGNRISTSWVRVTRNPFESESNGHHRKRKLSRRCVATGVTFPSPGVTSARSVRCRTVLPFVPFSSLLASLLHLLGLSFPQPRARTQPRKASMEDALNGIEYTPFAAQYQAQPQPQPAFAPAQEPERTLDRASALALSLSQLAQLGGRRRRCRKTMMDR